MFAYIPARIGSKRIPRKNIRDFFGKPIICHVIESLSKLPELKGIAVSTDSEEVALLVKGYQNVEILALRDHELANDQATFMDLVRDDIPRFSEYFASKYVLFVLPTAALISAKYFEQAIAQFKNNPSGLVMSVKEIDNRALLALMQNKGAIEPLFPENYKLPTEVLPKLYDDAGGFYCFDLEKVKLLDMFIELSPIKPVILPDEIAIDVDNESDWQALVQRYRARGG